MAIDFVSANCPACGAVLANVENDREFVFCSHCGSKVMMHNSNEYTYRQIDVAALKKAEMEQMIRLRELEIEEREKNRRRIGYSIAFGIALAFVLIGALMCLFGAYAGGAGVAIGIWIALFAVMSVTTNGVKQQERNYERNGMIKVADSLFDYEGKDYRIIESGFVGLGFTNVKTVNLMDLTTGLIKKPGSVEEVIINGKPLNGNQWFYQNAAIVITYHGFHE